MILQIWPLLLLLLSLLLPVILPASLRCFWQSMIVDPEEGLEIPLFCLLLVFFVVILEFSLCLCLVEVGWVLWVV